MYVRRRRKSASRWTCPTTASETPKVRYRYRYRLRFCCCIRRHRIVIHHHHLLVLVLVLLVAGLCLSRSLANLTCLQSLGLSDNRLTAKALPPLLQVCPSCFARSPSG